jgi:acetamidase/formamidase
MTHHHFHPDHYHTSLGPFEPVLTIAPGDTVTTTTVDAAGQDHTGEPITAPGNPMTGPFFVAGAERGDTLVVRLDALSPNRDTGWTGSSLASNVIDPWDVAALPERGRTLWNIDRHAQTTSPREPGRLESLKVPLAPMLGCFGVAPYGRQAISTATSGPNGGNMDYRGFVAGVTVYFPVFESGALFFLGDGHAVQGDGEIVGTGVETSFDATFSVQLQKGQRIGWPRGENDEFIFTAGNARPLDQALQHATSEMLKWLLEEFGFSAREASLLLGQCVRYEVGNVYDPAYTMVCKVPKSFIQLQQSARPQ